jgi:LuxR family maltose regulon positive regulatory protein
MRHALVAREYELAGDLFVENVQSLLQVGLVPTMMAWLEVLPDETIAGRPALALAVAWIAAVALRPQPEVARLLALAERSDYEGPYFMGERSRREAMALARAAIIFDDVGSALAAAQTAVEEASDPGSLSYVTARAALGQCLYLAGRPADAQAPLEEALRAPLAERQLNGVIHATVHLALACLELGDVSRASDLARRAVHLSESERPASYPGNWLPRSALSRVLAQQGRFEQAEAVLATGVEPHLPALSHWPISYARALLGLAPVRIARGHLQAARTLLEEARTVIEGCTDPGMLATLLADTEQRVQRAPRPRGDLREELTESELRILRLLSSDLTQREIARELYLSVNTVKSHTRTIYAKLGANSREAAILRARSLALIV